MAPMNNRLLRPIANNIDPDAAVYLNAVAQADGQPLEPAVRKAINDFIVGCKADGIWSAIRVSCILMGARTLAGALTPLVGSAPTNVNNNFVNGDYDRKTGLKGNGSNKTLLYSNVSFAQQADNSMSMLMTELQTLSARWALGFNAETSLGTAGVTDITFRNSNGQGINLSPGTPPVLLGTSRSGASAYTLARAGSTQTEAVVSNGTLSLSAFRVFGQGASGSSFSDFRLAFYHGGVSLSLSALNSRASALYAAIGAALP
jgi:hypothetical protein